MKKPRGGGGPQSLSPQRALQALRDALTLSSAKLRQHFRDQMATRSFDMNDVLYLSRTGAIRRPPEYDIKHGMWKYTVEGSDVDGAALEIVFAVDEQGSVRLVTGIRP